MRTSISFALLVVAVAGCRGTTDAPTGEGYVDLRADQVMIDVTHHPTSDGIRSAIGRYDTVFVFNDSAMYHVKGVDLQLFDADGRQSATIEADSGAFNQSTDAMIARGSVILITQQNCTIRTEELHYDPNTRRVWSEVTTRFEFGDRAGTSDSFAADDQFTRVTLTNARGQIPTECR